MRLRKVYIYGAGKRGQELFQVLDSVGTEILGFIDNSTSNQGTLVCGKLVESLQTCISKIKSENVMIVVSPREYSDIIAQLNTEDVEYVLFDEVYNIYSSNSRLKLDDEEILAEATTLYGKKLFYRIIKQFFFQNDFVMEELIDKLNRNYSVFGSRARVHLGKNTCMMNTLFNTSSGNIYIGDYTFTGHNVTIITGSHDINQECELRQTSVPQNRDVVIGKGVWLCSGAMILGPCRIGNNSVVAAGSVVLPNTIIEDNELWAGVPAVKKKDVKSF